MKVKIAFPGAMDAEIKILTTDGKELVLDVKEVTIEPYFTSSSAQPTCFTASTHDMKDAPINRYLYTVSGVTGKLLKRPGKSARTRFDVAKYGAGDE